MAKTNISPHNMVETTKQADPLRGFGSIDGSHPSIQPTPHAFCNPILAPKSFRMGWVNILSWKQPNSDPYNINTKWLTVNLK